ncbi:MAG: CYTH domain-containing protein [Candidatus Micrarchaeota archaeon]|nr:CYTH domain-containing protein [Candidatus Micrarchaeota archaeon]MDE1847883.1 CYTH domain-containing protein [Candidatus Micrarchaeota archaeon]MDE1864509.1 CYTH domain-containing protein [Candidatus Micrarchaeota archaeon]
MGNKQEVEKRAILPLDKKQEVVDKLIGQGAKLNGEKGVNDIYFCTNSVKSFEEVEMDEVGSYSLRIREEKHGGKTERSMNVKVITSYGDHHSWAEHEIKISSIEDTEALLKVIGFKPFCKIEKNRKEFKLGNKSIFLEDILGFGLGIEVEILTTQEETEKAKKEIDDTLRILGIDRSQIVPKSITNMIMREKAKF